MSPLLKLFSPATRVSWEIPVVYEDEHLIALSKPSGLLTSPDRRAPDEPSLMKLLHAAIAEGKPWAKQRNLAYLMNTHRLDLETSGVLLLAKSKPVLVALVNFLNAGRPGRKYLALARGSPAEDRFEVQAKLAPDLARPGLMRVDARRGKRSHTLFAVLEKFAGFTLLQCEPLTDRAHQVRIHLRSVALPVVGDQSYGGLPLLLSRLKRDYRLKPNASERPLIACAAIHAAEIALPHPLTGQPLAITAPWPKDLSVAIKYLRKYAPANSRT